MNCWVNKMGLKPSYFPSWVLSQGIATKLSPVSTRGAAVVNVVDVHSFRDSSNATFDPVALPLCDAYRVARCRKCAGEIKRLFLAFKIR